MKSSDLLALLGRYNTDPLVEAALRYYAVRNRPEIEIDEDDAGGPVVSTYSWVKNSRAGVEFGFQDEAAWIGLDETEFGKHPMVLTEVYFYGRHVGVRPYQEEMPFGLRLADDRATVSKKLFRFEPTRHSYIRDTWDMPDFRVTVAYTADDSGIRFVLCMLREPPLAPLKYALAPVPSIQHVLGLLGTTFDDPALHSTFKPLGLQGRSDEVAETREVDLRNPYGLLLEFCVPADTPKPRAKDILLLGVMFFEEREQGARRWSGELPHALSFEDSPETAVRKLGRPPDIQNDNEDNFSGVAVWHEPRLTISVFYDTMENRLRRVGVAAPDTGQSAGLLGNCFGPR